MLKSSSILPTPPFALSRRSLLKRTAAGFGMLGLASLLGTSTSTFGANAPRISHLAPRAKRVIFLFLNGGPSHLDTFDPKPALAKFEGEKPDSEIFRGKDKVG